MQQKFEGLKTTISTFIAIALVVFTTQHTQTVWQDQLPFIEQMLGGLAIAGIILATQFGRSRYAILICLWTLYYLVQVELLPGKALLESQRQGVFLTGVLIFFLLSLVKDRRVLSIHGILRCCGLVLCAVFAHAWIIGLQWLLTDTQLSSQAIANYTSLSIELAFVCTALLILLRSIRQASLLMASLLTSLVVWADLYLQYLQLELSVLLLILSLQYILVVLIDSYFLAYRDELTKLPSRRALQQFTLSLGRKYTVAMIDIDHFKKFNDNYGHDIGDQVLKLVATKIADNKQGGSVFRFGGEEFIIVFTNNNLEQCALILNNIRQKIAEYQIIIRHPSRKTKKARQLAANKTAKSVSVTISIGVATRQTKCHFEQTVKSADQALYRAKRKGRNNVCY